MPHKQKKASNNALKNGSPRAEKKQQQQTEDYMNESELIGGIATLSLNVC